VAAGERTLITTLTKRLAEDLAEYITQEGFRCKYLHSEIETLERVEILKDLRGGTFDVLVGVNLLREGLDLPEVSLVAILDADREGFLRSETSLIQIMGRAARHVEGLVIMYADRITPSMQAALGESERRRNKQMAYNEARGITPQTVRKEVRDTIRSSQEEQRRPASRVVPEELAEGFPEDDLAEIIAALQAEMSEAAQNLEFERAAELRDEIKELESLARR
jgi:excinuclease ABC subunit B